MKPLDYLAEAVHEAAEAHEYYRERNQDAARRFMASFRTAVDSVRDYPQRFPIHKLGTRRLLLEGFPYSVIYQDLADRVLIVAVPHAKRHPTYWKRRLK